MTLRHKAVKATLDKGYAFEWNDDHHIDFTDELIFYDTFFYNALQGFWSTAQCAVDGTAAIAMVSGHNFLALISGTTAGSVASLRLGTADMTNKTDLPIMTAAVKVDTILSSELGFFTSAGTPFTANQKGAYFRISASKLYAVTGDGAAETATDITPADFAINKYYILRVEFTSTQVKFYVDDLVTAKATHSNNITTDNLTLKLSTKVSGGVSQILHSDGVGLQRLRKQ